MDLICATLNHCKANKIQKPYVQRIKYIKEPFDIFPSVAVVEKEKWNGEYHYPLKFAERNKGVRYWQMVSSYNQSMQSE